MSERLHAILAAQNESPLQMTTNSDDDDSSSESAEFAADVTNESDSSDEVEDEGEGDEELEKKGEIAEAELHVPVETLSVNENNVMVFVCEALGDFVAEEADDLSFRKGDILTVISMRADGWWKAEDQTGKQGMVPSSFLKVPDKVQKYLDGTLTGSSRLEKGQFWKSLHNTVKQYHNIEEAITSMGALPIGFCPPSLQQLVESDSRYSTEAFLAPKFSDTGLSFRDLHFSSSTNSLKPVTTQLQRSVRLVAFRKVCLPGSGFEISSHHVRICLHDGSKVLSNIHTIKAKFDPKIPKIWSFAPKLSSNGSSLEEGNFFIRSNVTSPTIGVLFQLCISFSEIATGKIGEMSCGWVFMRLLDDSGMCVPNRKRILRIHSGVPFRNQNDSPSMTGTKTGPLKLFINRGKNPRLVVSISTLKGKHDQLLNFLPTTLIGPISSIPLLVLYRKILADKLLKNRASFDSTELVLSPFLATFPKAFGQPDIIDVFRKCWSDKVKKMKQIMKDEENKKLCFQQLFMETVFLILHCHSIPSYSLGNVQVEKDRRIEILQIMKLIKDSGSLSVAMSPSYQFHPLSLSELSFNIIGKHSLSIVGIE